MADITDALKAAFQKPGTENVNIHRILKADPSQSTATDKDGNPAAYYATSQAQLKMLKKYGADLNATNKEGRTPMMQAVVDAGSKDEKVREEAMKKIALFSQDPDSIRVPGKKELRLDNDGNSVLMLIPNAEAYTAVVGNSNQLVKPESGFPGEINRRGSDGYTLLERTEDPKLYNHLIVILTTSDQGFKVNDQDKDGLTVLAKAQTVEKVEALLAIKGIDPINIKAKDGRTQREVLEDKFKGDPKNLAKVQELFDIAEAKAASASRAKGDLPVQVAMAEVPADLARDGNFAQALPAGLPNKDRTSQVKTGSAI